MTYCPIKPHGTKRMGQPRPEDHAQRRYASKKWDCRGSDTCDLRPLPGGDLRGGRGSGIERVHGTACVLACCRFGVRLCPSAIRGRSNGWMSDLSVRSPRSFPASLAIARISTASRSPRHAGSDQSRSRLRHASTTSEDPANTIGTRRRGELVSGGWSHGFESTEGASATTSRKSCCRSLWSC